MRFVFLGPELCLQLPSHDASRHRSCCSARGSRHKSPQRTCTSKSSRHARHTKKKRLTVVTVSRGLWGSDPGFHGCGGSEMRGQNKIRRASSYKSISTSVGLAVIQGLNDSPDDLSKNKARASMIDQGKFHPQSPLSRFLFRVTAPEPPRFVVRVRTIRQTGDSCKIRATEASLVKNNARCFTDRQHPVASPV